MTYSASARRSVFATSADADLLVALEITHPDLAAPVRVVNDSQSLLVTINVGGVATQVEFVACPFDITFPDDVDQQIPKATLSVSNIGRELTQWLEVSRGGRGAQVRILQCLRSYAESYTPTIDINTWNPWEMDIKLDMSGITIDNQVVSAELGYKRTAGIPAVAVRYDPASSPGMF